MRPSCLTFTTSSTGSSAPAAHGARPGAGYAILLVEDDSAVRSATRMLLRVEGYSVRAAGSMAEALACLADGARCDLLITDYHLGGAETGTEVIAQVRERLGQTLPAVLITGDTPSAVRTLQSARLRLARKPIRADELLELLKSLLRGAPQAAGVGAQPVA